MCQLLKADGKMAFPRKGNHLPLAISVLLVYGAHSVLASGCVDSSTVMFGAPWQSSFTVSEQETQYQQRGDISQLRVFFNTASGCVEGLAASYGYASSIAATIGVDLETSADSSTLVAQEIRLSAGEVIDGIEYKVGNCIEYLKFFTSKGNILEVGNPDSPRSLQSSKPAPGSFLGFFKGTVNPAVAVTEESNTALPLQQLQLVWVTKDCSSNPDGEVIIPADAGVDPTAANRLRVTRAQQRPQQTAQGPAQAAAPVPAGDAVVEEVPMPSDSPTFGDDATILVTGSAGEGAAQPNTTAVPAAAAPAVAATAGAGPTCAPQGCEDGVCATSSCTLNGMGKEAAAMLCFGTNIIPNMMKDQVPTNPCSNLACKHTKPNCTSNGLLGIGGFCTGRVVAMGATAELHETGKKLVGYPCIEHRGLITEMVSKFGDYSAKGTYVAKAWKVCDCSPVNTQTSGSVQVTDAPGKGHQNGHTTVHITTPSVSVTVEDVSAALSKQQLPRMPDFNVDLSDVMDMLQKPVINMTMPDVVVQWMSAFASKTTVPRFSLSSGKLDALKVLLPGFTVPSFIVPNISAPLLKVPITIDIPAFTIPDKTFPLVALLLPNITNTSLPSLVLPSKMPNGVRLPGGLNIRNISTPNFYGMMERFILRLPDYEFKVNIPQFPSFKPVIDVPDVITQWMAGFMANSPLPKIQLTNETLSQLRSLLPRFPQLPAMISFEVAVPWLSVEAARDIATFIIPDNLLTQVRKLLPSLSSLPTILEPRDITVQIPTLTVPNITLSTFKEHVTQIMDRLPAVSIQTTGNTTAAESFNFLDHITDAAGSFGLAVQQVFGKHTGSDTGGLNLAGLGLGSLQVPTAAAAADAPSSSATTTPSAATASNTTAAASRPAPEELPVDTSDDEDDEGAVAVAEGQPVVQEAPVP